MQRRIRCHIQVMVYDAFWFSMVVWIDALLKTTVFSEFGSLREGASPERILIVSSISLAVFGFIVLRLMRETVVHNDTVEGAMRKRQCESSERKDDLPSFESIHMRNVIGGQLGLLVIGLVLWTWQLGGINEAVQALIRIEHPERTGVFIVLALGALGILNVLLDRVARHSFPRRWWWDASFMFFLRFSGVRLLFIILLVAVSEEILFRGFVLTWMTQFFRSSLVGVVLASYVFMRMHMQYRRKPVLQVAVFLSGIIFSLLYVWTGSIVAVIAAHFLYDFILLMALKRWPSLYEDDLRYDAAFRKIEENDAIDDTIRQAYEREQQLERMWRFRLERLDVDLIRLLTVTAFGVVIGVFLWVMFGAR